MSSLANLTQPVQIPSEPSPLSNPARCTRLVVRELEELYAERAVASYRLIMLQIGAAEGSPREQAILKRHLDNIAADVRDRELWLADREGWPAETVAAWRGEQPG